MPLIWNEIRDRAIAFAHDWAEESYERGEAQTFWNEFFQVFGLNRRRAASFEAHVSKLGDAGAGESGFIDCFWPGTLIAEHKSRGKDLDSAYIQAIDYFANLKERDLPQYVVVSDFATIRPRRSGCGSKSAPPKTAAISAPRSPTPFRFSTPRITNARNRWTNNWPPFPTSTASFSPKPCPSPHSIPRCATRYWMPAPWTGRK